MIPDVLGSEIPYLGVSLWQIIMAILILVVGYIVLKIVISFIKKSLIRAKTPEIVAILLSKLIFVIGMVFVILAAAGALGIDTGPVVLGISAILAFVIGFGMQDSFANLAAGIWLATLRPFDRGDVVSVSGLTGKVEEIGILSTTLITPDNTFITMPNRTIWGAPIINYTRFPIRRLSVSVGVAYGTDIGKAMEVAMNILKNHPKILKTPEPAVLVSELGDSSVNLELRGWVNKADFAAVKADLVKTVYEVFTQENIEIPYPQMDIHVKEMPEK